MAGEYGIRFFGSGDYAQIDSESTGTGFIVRSSGTSSALGLPATGEQTFARPNVRSSTVTIAYQALSTTPGFTPGFYDTAGNAVVCDWIRGVWADSLTASTTGDGLQVYNSSNQLAFDSEAYNGNGGFGITNYVTSGTITPQPNNDVNNGIGVGTVISTDLNAYYDMGRTGRLSGFTNRYAGYVFRPVTGVHWLGSSTIMGLPPFGVTTTSYSTNPTIFYGEAGSV